MKKSVKTLVMVLAATSVLGITGLTSASSLTDSQKLQLIQEVQASEAAFVPKPQMWYYTPKNGIYSFSGNVQQKYLTAMAVWEQWKTNDVKLHQAAREAGLI